MGHCGFKNRNIQLQTIKIHKMDPPYDVFRILKFDNLVRMLLLRKIGHLRIGISEAAWDFRSRALGAIGGSGGGEAPPRSDTLCSISRLGEPDYAAFPSGQSERILEHILSRVFF